MNEALHRTNLSHVTSRSLTELRFPIADWCWDPDFSNVDGVPKKYWEIPVVDPGPEEMDTAAKAVVDAADLAAANAATREQVLAAIDPQRALDGRSWSISADDLTISFKLDQLIDDSYTATADVSDTKFVEASLINDTDAAEADSLVMLVRTKTTELYANLDSNHSFVSFLGEWSVVANGTVLVEVT
ncbi:MAG: hypothetical protein KAJ19_12405 [Gammaproteobacteria bacterium]|nr:hypothetical protein [Gammaproteobacteria bacterium]